MAEIDEVNGAGKITMNRERMIFILMYHQGDDYTFECERESLSDKSKSKKRRWLMLKSNPRKMLDAIAPVSLIFK